MRCSFSRASYLLRHLTFKGKGSATTVIFLICRKDLFLTKKAKPMPSIEKNLICLSTTAETMPHQYNKANVSRLQQFQKQTTSCKRKKWSSCLWKRIRGMHVLLAPSYELVMKDQTRWQLGAASGGSFVNRSPERPAHYVTVDTDLCINLKLTRQ